jgi:ABC-type transport system involved in multi-copper enzyme maturation permease subunit
MKAVWLIGVNFVRQQKVLLFVMVAWLLLFGAALGFVVGGENIDDVMALFRQEAAYGVIVTVFISASAISGERRSRRIIAVLAKGIYRAEYLAGIMTGNVLMAGIYFLLVGIVNQALATRFSFNADIWPTLAAGFIASILAAALALLLSTFLHPLLSSAFTMGILALPFLAPALVLAIPVAYVIRQTLDFQYERGWQGGWEFAAVAAVEIVVCFAAAAAIFGRRDVTSGAE